MTAAANVAGLSPALRDDFVRSLEGAGVSPDAARREADRRFGPVEADQRRENVREKEEQRHVRDRFVVCGFKVRSTSQSRASKVAPGLPDLILVHRSRAWFLFWECKRSKGGKYSDAQLEFRADCERAGVTCLGGDRLDAERFLVANHFARVHNGTFEPIGEP